MEIAKKEIRCNNIGKKVQDQFWIDQDINVPDAKSDVKRIILSEGTVKVEDIRLVDHYARATGKVCYQILYETDEMECGIASLQGVLPFEEMVYLEEEPKGQVHLKSCRTEIQVSVIHSRKINIKAITELELGAEWECEESLTTDINGKHRFCKKYKDKNVLCLESIRKDTYRIKEEVKLPGTKENIGNVLWNKVMLRKLDTRLGRDELLLRGEIQVFCFYESLEKKTDWIEQNVAFEGRLECTGVRDHMYHHIYTCLQDENMEIRMDEDGEMRILGVEATLGIRVFVYEEEQISILQDIYSLSDECVLQMEELQLESMIMQNHSKYKMAEQLSLPEIKDSILQICHSGGHIQIEHTEPVVQGIMVEGMMHVYFLYIKADDQSPFEVWQGMVPFTHVIEAKDISADIIYDIEKDLEQISIGLLGNDAVEIKAMLAFRVFLRRKEVIPNIQGIQIEPLNIEKLEKQPGIIGYIVKEGDSFWEIAKNYKTTIDAVKEDNAIVGDQLKPGDKILIFKENIGIL